jgi:hypothetical protein
MELALWIIGINWGVPVLLLLYPLVMMVVWKDFVFEGFYGPFFKFRLANKDLEPWHVKLWRDWGGVGLGWCMCYKDKPTKADDAWVARTIVHEGTHCWQWLFLGLFFYVTYMVHMLWILITQRIKGKPYTKHPYLDCWPERMARKKAGQLVDVPPDQWPQGKDDLWPWW